MREASGCRLLILRISTLTAAGARRLRFLMPTDLISSHAFSFDRDLDSMLCTAARRKQFNIISSRLLRYGDSSSSDRTSNANASVILRQASEKQLCPRTRLLIANTKQWLRLRRIAMEKGHVTKFRRATRCQATLLDVYVA